MKALAVQDQNGRLRLDYDRLSVIKQIRFHGLKLHCNPKLHRNEDKKSSLKMSCCYKETEKDKESAGQSCGYHGRITTREAKTS
jgi:hypothetical protein